MKRIKHIFISIPIIALMLSACAKGRMAEVKEDKVNFDEYADLHEIMFKASHSNWGLVDGSSDFWNSDVITVYYDGTIHMASNYNLSGMVLDYETELSKEDFEALTEFLESNFVKGKSDEEIDACDGSAWGFTYYSPEGEVLHKFFGYTYGITELEEIQSMLYSYMPEYDVPELYSNPKEKDVEKKDNMY